MRKVIQSLRENWIPIVVGIILTKRAVEYAYPVSYTHLRAHET